MKLENSEVTCNKTVIGDIVEELSLELNNWLKCDLDLDKLEDKVRNIVGKYGLVTNMYADSCNCTYIDLIKEGRGIMSIKCSKKNKFNKDNFFVVGVATNFNKTDKV